MKFYRSHRDQYFWRSCLPYFFIFHIAFVSFLILQSKPTFPDPDSFYHLKIVELISEQGVVNDFPWAQFSVLKDNYIDHHLLYHFALVPFIIIFGSFLGLKIATVLFSSFFILFFYWFLRTLGVRYASLYAYILIGTNSFIFRLNLAKATGPSLLFLFFGIFCIIHRKYLWLFVLSFFYVWLYGGWPLILFVGLIYSISEILFLVLHQSRWSFMSKFFRIFHISKARTLTQKMRDDAKMLGSIVMGLVAGIVINPYFPKNLLFYWQQIYEIAVVNYHEFIGVGGEWYPYNPLSLIAHSKIAFLLLVVGLTFFFLNIKNQNRKSVFFLLLTLIFLFLTFRSRRNVEYLIPFSVFFSALSIEYVRRIMDIKRFYYDIKIFLMEKKFILGIFFIFFGAFSFFLVNDIFEVKKSYDSGFAFDYLQGPSKWLKKNSEQKQIVFTSDWDEFPFLFYHNSHNYYIVGLDPTFMYIYDKDLHRKWESVTNARASQEMYSIIKNDFLASYVLVSTGKHENFDRLLKKNKNFLEVFRDIDSVIYKVL